jgi:hypothetical protein
MGNVKSGPGVPKGQQKEIGRGFKKGGDSKVRIPIPLIDDRKKKTATANKVATNEDEVRLALRQKGRRNLATRTA